MQSQRSFLKAPGRCTVSLTMNCSLEAKTRSSAKPNIILCVADDQGWGEMGYNAHPCLRTPVFDEMAATGLRFDRFYSAASVCPPYASKYNNRTAPNRSDEGLPDYINLS